MADRKIRSPYPDVGDPTSAAELELTDESDGTHSPVRRSRLEGWTGTEWIKIAVDSAGNIATSAATAGPAANVTIVGSTITQPVSGTVSITGSTVPVSGTLTVAQAVASALKATVTQGTSPWVVDGSGVTQPVSGAVNASIVASSITQAITGPVSATIAATSVTQPVSGSISITGTTLPVSGTVAVSGTVTVNGSASTQPVSGTVAATQSGTWTVQPGNTANTTAWKVDGSAVTQPVSGSVTATIGATSVTQPVSGSLTVVQPTASALNATVVISGSTVPVTNAGTFATQETQLSIDNAAFTDGTTKVWPAGFVFDDSIESQTALTENDVGAARINANRAVANVIEDGTKRGQYATVTPSGAITVVFDPTVFDEIRDQLRLIVAILTN